MIHLSVRWRLTLWYVLALTAVVIAFGAGVYGLIGRHLQDRSDFELREELDELVLELRLSHSEAELLSQLHQRFSKHADFDFQVNRADGSILFRSDRVQTPVEMPSALSGNTSAEWSSAMAGLGLVRIAARREESPTGPYSVLALVPVTGNEQQLREVLNTMTTIGPLAILVSLIGGYWLASRALKPVESMAVTAEKITAQSLHSRITVIDRADELGRLATTFNSMLDRLERSMDDMRRFTADAAHELRTPLAVMRAEIEVALRSSSLSPDCRAVLDVTLEQARRLGHLAERLLTLCRYESNVVAREDDDVPFDSLLLDVVDRLRETARNLSISLDVGPMQETIVRGDDTQLSQLLFNLLDNAIKFTKPGGQVFVRLAADGKRMRVTVSDTGIGIPADELPHVFNRFYRADKSRNARTGGAGLGLAICKAIAESHSGVILIDSKQGHGTTVTVELPLAVQNTLVSSGGYATEEQFATARNR